MLRLLIAASSALLFAAAAWLGAAADNPPADEAWREVAPAVWQSGGFPHSYALVDGDAALLFGATRGADLPALKARGVKTVDICFLTHHHRDSVAGVPALLAAGVNVRAPRASEEWLGPERVARFWKTALPIVVPGQEVGLRDRTFGEWEYLMVPQGIPGIGYNVEHNVEIAWRGWTIRSLATPGHCRDHMAYITTKRGSDGKPAQGPFAFCGDAIAAPGKMWSPYTTDWDHWTDNGLKTSAASLRALANHQPVWICPEHGAPWSQDIGVSLAQTAEKLEAIGFLKSFERFSKQKLGDAPQYEFLAPDQVASAGEKPWTQVSQHLYLTGNTYVLASRDGPILVIDPFGKKYAEQLKTLQETHKLGPVERIFISHAHNDHYTGLFQMPVGHAASAPEIWSLDEVARPLSKPFELVAPFVDARPVAFQRVIKDGETATWREYTFKFRHFPGQSWFTMGWEAHIDGRKCFFTADNFFHADQFSGSGGWSGRNRGWPLAYADSAQKVLNAAPDWVLAEHGGPFAFSPEDFRRRVAWGRATGEGMDAICPTGKHQADWHPQRVRIEPLLSRVKAGGEVTVELIADNPLGEGISLSATADSRLATGASAAGTVPAGQTLRLPITLRVAADAIPGRHVIPFVVLNAGREDAADTIAVLDVEP